MEKLQRELDEQLHANTQLMADCSQKQVEIKVKEDEINRLRTEAQRIDKLREATLLKLKQMENQKREVEGTRDELKATIHNMEREVDAMRRASEAERKKQEELMRERDVLNKLKTSAEGATQRQMDLVAINEAQKKTLEQEVQAFKIEAQKQAKAMWQLEKEREKYGMEASDATAKYMTALEEVKLREMAIIDQQKKIVEAEARLKQQQTLYEGVRGDRNLYSKNLIEAQDDIGDMKRKFKIMQARRRASGAALRSPPASLCISLLLSSSSSFSLPHAFPLPTLPPFHPGPTPNSTKSTSSRRRSRPRTWPL